MFIIAISKGSKNCSYIFPSLPLLGGIHDRSSFSDEQSEGLDIKNQVRLFEGVFIESCYPNIENTHLAKRLNTAD